MTKEEALRKIDELRKFVEEQDKKRHPEYCAGQVYRHKKSGDLYMVRREQHVDGRKFDLVALDNGVGMYWNRNGLMDLSADSFDYVGMFSEVFTRR